MSSRKNFETEHLVDKPDHLDKVLAPMEYLEPTTDTSGFDIDDKMITCSIPLKWVPLMELLRQMSPDQFAFIEKRAENITGV
jgi:hypothetical protein